MFRALWVQGRPTQEFLLPWCLQSGHEKDMDQKAVQIDAVIKAMKEMYWEDELHGGLA